MTEDTRENVVQTALDAAADPSIKVDLEGVYFVRNEHGGYSEKRVDLEPFFDRPRRIRASETFATPQSFAEYWRRYADGDSLILRDIRNFMLTAKLDYHEGGDGTGENKARWGEHTAIYRARPHPAYGAWRDRHRKAIKQRDALEFLEDRLEDITQPAAADVYDRIMEFEALKSVSFRSMQRLRDNTIQLRYSEEDAASGNTTLPAEMKISVPVFEGQEPQEMAVRIRYRIDAEGGLTFTFVIANIEDIERRGFEAQSAVFCEAAGIDPGHLLDV